jgi:hypothetical protein
MGLHMLNKRILVCISFTTHFTFVDFLPKLHIRMNAPLVSIEAMFVSESDAALFTLIGLLPCV